MTVTYFTECGGGTGTQPFELTFAVAGRSVPITPAAFGADGVAEIWIDVEDGRPSLGLPAVVQVEAGSVEPGGSASYAVDKEPGDAPPGTLPPTTGGLSPTTGDGTTPTTGPVDPCAEFEEGSMMRILCEHDPTTNDVSRGGA